MPPNAQVLVAHGPYEACGNVDYRTSRLEGLQAMLHKEGHTVELEEIEDWNKVEIWVNGEKVFDCKIQDLEYGSDGELDPLCQKAVENVNNAF
ncbi:UPF0728 protein-like [Mytilus californianus]|uniref:UPF0728 protein-like n=1 Tax=Mytilus californianus TaxID=6549 RepID=UPI002246B060|nr:UPF0728 protein-like [Mytilus californianus]XP_052068808.1 UPF0728 protein-like [Mytilus californianus]